MDMNKLHTRVNILLRQIANEKHVPYICEEMTEEEVIIEGYDKEGVYRKISVSSQMVMENYNTPMLVDTVFNNMQHGEIAKPKEDIIDYTKIRSDESIIADLELILDEDISIEMYDTIEQAMIHIETSSIAIEVLEEKLESYKLQCKMLKELVQIYKKKSLVNTRKGSRYETKNN